MTLIRKNELVPAWSHLFNDVFNQDWFDWSNRNYSDTNTTLPSVNVKEADEGFEVEMAAPGMEKEDFRIEVNNGFMTISSEKKSESREEDKKGRYTKKEFCYQSFSRSFSLPVSVDSDKIEAKYDKGILTVSIPKREESKPKPVRQIAIA
jgi:HSP20 family protein